MPFYLLTFIEASLVFVIVQFLSLQFKDMLLAFA